MVEPADPARSDPASRAPPALAGLRLLVIEDEPLVAMDMAATLSAAGAVVERAGTLEAARRRLADLRPDAALLDGNLQGKPVDTLAAALRRQGVPFVFVTGYGRDALPPDFADVAVLEKPFRPAQLLAAVAALLGRLPSV